MDFLISRTRIPLKTDKRELTSSLVGFTIDQSSDLAHLSTAGKEIAHYCRQRQGQRPREPPPSPPPWAPGSRRRCKIMFKICDYIHAMSLVEKSVIKLTSDTATITTPVIAWASPYGASIATLLAV